MEVIILKNAEVSSIAAAHVIARQVRNKKNCVLGLATGGTPVAMYQELIRLHKEEGLDFSEVITFNLDEYVGLAKGHEQSYHTFMWQNLFSHINVNQANVNIPDGLTEDIPAFCEQYEAAIVAAGGIDIQVLGIGTDGHVGFNEPTSSFASRTRIKTLTEQTCKDNARYFDGDQSQVPRHCITMGIGTIMDAKMNLLLAFGEGKANAIKDTIEGPVSAMVPATILQHHSNAKVFIDEGSASKLKLASYYKWVYDGKPDWQKDL